MSKRLGIGFIGLGSIGQRMLRNAALHARVRPVAAWDPDAEKMQRSLHQCPALEAVDSAAAVMAHPGVDVVYVASPPASHAEYAGAALERGTPVLCEKPLGIDMAVSRALVEQAQRAGVPNAVNFIFASGPGTTLASEFARGTLGTVRCVDVHLHARQWAERRYAEAPWLARSGQGGLVREVLSHYVYLSQRLFGPPLVRFASVRGNGTAGAAETQVMAELECGAVAVRILGTTEGAGPDVFEYTLWGDGASRTAFGLYQLRGSGGGRWQPCGDTVSDPAAAWFSAQLDNIADWATGEAHTMPDFAAALSVQEVIEAIRGG